MMKFRQSAQDDGNSDEALLAGMAVGDDQAGLTFVRRYQRRLFGLALGIVGDPGLAEDVSQEAFVRIFRHASVFDARRGSVSTWVLTITRNLAIDSVRVRRGIPIGPDDGQDVGPDLSNIGRTDRRHLLESILQPSNNVAPSSSPQCTVERPKRSPVSRTSHLEPRRVGSGSEWQSFVMTLFRRRRHERQHQTSEGL